MKISELFESDVDKLSAWKDEVKKAYPEFASKMKFKGRFDKKSNTDTICAEVPGMDRCFGVFDTDKMTGEVLGEGMRGILGAAIIGAAVGAGIAASPKVEIDGTTYDKALGHSYERFDIKPKKKQVEVKGEKKTVLYWTEPSGKHGRTANIYTVVESAEVSDWRLLNAEEMFHFAVDHLDEDELEQLDAELQGLHVEDEEDHAEAREIMIDFLSRHLHEGLIMEKRPAGAPKWRDSNAPDANGKFKELGVNDLADWLIKTRGADMQKISGSLTQQIVFNRKKNPTYAKKMESVRAAVKRKLKKD